jgi:hypothetical protein
MNLKLPIKIAKAQMANLLEYAKDSGYEVAKKHLGDLVTYTIDHPRYDDTPLVESCQDDFHRWAHFTYLRLEKANEATDWEAAFKELKNLTLAVNDGPPVPDLDVDIRTIVKAHTRGNHLYTPGS